MCMCLLSPGAIYSSLENKWDFCELGKLQSTDIGQIKKNLTQIVIFFKYLVSCGVQGNLYGPKAKLGV